MCSTNNRKSFFLWIFISTWISCYESLRLENVRRNQDEKGCKSELVSNDLLSDEQFSASSYFQNKKIFEPSMARLTDIHSGTSPGDGRAWCPATDVHRDLTEWIEIDFRRMMILNSLYTMGRGDGNFQKFSPQIVMKYQRSASGTWYTYHDSQNETVIQINTDARTKLRTNLQTIVVRKIRIYPLDTLTGPKSVCLKVAFLGCYFEDEVVSYNIPQGDRKHINGRFMNLQDNMYDGNRSQILQDGLGVLMDNMAYMNPNKTDNILSTNLNGFFTGWKCTYERKVKPIVIKFFYNHERIFSQLSIYFLKNETYRVGLVAPVTVSIGYNNETHRRLYNFPASDGNGSFVSGILLNIPINHVKGTLCTLVIPCPLESWIILSEIEIKSTRFHEINDPVDTNERQHISTNTSTIITGSDFMIGGSSWIKKNATMVLVVGLVLVVAMILLIFGLFVFYKLKILKRQDKNKKLEIVAKYTDRSLTDPHMRTTFTIQSKHASVPSMAKMKYCTDNRTSVTNAYSGSQVSDGVYASWPNTDDDADVPRVDIEDGKFLLALDGNDSQNANKDYAIYQPSMELTGNEYFHVCRPSSVVISRQSLMSLPDKFIGSVSSPKIVSVYDPPKSNPLIHYRNSTNVICYQHLLNYTGICGDVDFRYQSDAIRLEPPKLDSNIRVVPSTTLEFVKSLVRGKFGGLDLVTVALDNKDKCPYFLKTLDPELVPEIKSKFLLDLKILSSLTISTVARLAAIVVHSDQFRGNIADAIKSGRFSLLVENSGGYNLKEFLRSMYYPSQGQKYKSTPIGSPTQISSSFALLVITQISNALRHLEELGLTHRDVGCRNCTIDLKRQIKLYPGGYVTAHHLEDYFTIDLKNNLIHFPLRWLSPESISKGIFTSKSDVWSFGVTMWEVFTLCSLVPYTSLSNEALLELMVDRDNTPKLICPQNCPKEMYDLMRQCWSWDASLRPTFKDISLFLQIKVTGSTNPAQYILPSPPPSVTDIYHSI